ncbi:MAG: hypothetical protein M1832_002504 [Thelocarpon impressellum]|nr:MAG: hypothetical protein M1832_002504 [Thelocarpon impressellum]
MASQLPTPPSEGSPGDGNSRKRVCKACDRCRLKKSKCDGATPCSRCRSDNAICVFGERKKSHDKVYPKGYVEMLEQQQAQLVAGLQDLYRRIHDGSGWTGAPLRNGGQGAPLTHDILEQLGALKTEHGGEAATFEEDLQLLQYRLFEGGARPMSRHRSPASEAGSGPTSPHGSLHDSLHGSLQRPGLMFCSSDVEPVDAPPTPCARSPTRPMGPVDVRAGKPQFAPSSTYYADPGQLQQQQQPPQPQPQPTWPLPATVRLGDGHAVGLGVSMQGLEHLMPGMGPCLVPDWSEDEEFRAFLGQIVG